jgi:hypothetical protein
MATTTTMVMTVATAALSVLPAPAPASGNQVAMVEIPEDDAPSSGWG